MEPSPRAVVRRAVRRKVLDAVAHLPAALQPGRLVDAFEWAIGITVAEHPLAVAAPAEPTLTRRSVTDVPADFVADPFLAREDGWWCLFEVGNRRRMRGEIGAARSDDGRRWSYIGIVLSEPFHLSYPQPVRADGAWWLVPETAEAGEVRLYRAETLPGPWEHAATILDRVVYDATVFRDDDGWWCLGDTGAPEPWGELRLWHAEALGGPWREHPASPIASGADRSRPAGSTLVVDGVRHRLAQDCSPAYGTAVRAFAVTDLTADRYAETEVDGSPVLAPSRHPWNARGMHHLDARRLGDGRWLVAMDGR